MTERIVSVETTVHGRCVVRDATAGPARALIVGFHGYAQVGEEHLESLCRIPEAERYCLAAVQALHPFYRGRDGRIGASWMTSQDRQLAIAANVAYAGRAVDRIRAGLPATQEMQPDDPPLVYLGFSQGASMAWRAAVLGGRRCAGIVALAGDMPPELADEDLSRLPKALIAQGTRDEWYDDARRRNDVERLTAAGGEAQVVVFSGGHEWHEEFYRALDGYLAEVSEPAGSV